MILAIFISILLFSQNIRKDFCIFIDGKMVREIEDSFFIYKDSLGIEKKINFKCVPGDIILTKKYADYIISLNSENTLEMHIKYCKKNTKSKNKCFEYIGIIKVQWFKWPYLLVRITNLNEKKGKYYIGFSTPKMIDKWHFREARIYH